MLRERERERENGRRELTLRCGFSNLCYLLDRGQEVTEGAAHNWTEERGESDCSRASMHTGENTYSETTGLFRHMKRARI